MAGQRLQSLKYPWILILWVILAKSRDVMCQSDTLLSYSVKEEEGPGAFLGNIYNDARLFLVYNATVKSELQWSILEHDKNWNEFFSVSNQGLFQTTQSIDRDELCPAADVCLISLNIQLLPYQYFRIIKVQVEVLDINDNIPQFSVDNAKFSLPESSTPGTSLAISTAEDQDSPRFGVTQYNLISSVDLFELNYSVEVDEEFFYLVLVGSLDREVTDKYNLQIVATDGGTPQNSAVLSVEIEVLDINDNSPKFDKETYDIKVTENLEVGSAILTLAATDPDQGAKIQYSFSEKTLKSFGDIFYIGQETGTITTKIVIDYENKSSYTLNVIARDESLLTLSAQAVVQIKVVDLNDNSPGLLLNIFNGNSTHVLIEEGAAAGRSVAHMVVTDPDSGRGGQFDCFLGNNRFKLDKISESDFKILSTTALDREESSSYKLTIRCDDHGFPSLSSNKTLIIVVLDVNDNAPVFSQQLYRASMLYDSSVGTSLLTVEAQDKDEGLSGAVSYAIQPPMDQVFRINITSGHISVKTLASFADKAWVNFTVKASDHGLPGRFSLAHVVIDIVHIVDAIPEFMQKMYLFNIMENLPEKTEVGQVALQPSLNGLNIKFVFQIISQSKENMFTIDEHTGKLYTAKVPDREKTDNFLLLLSAGVAGVKKTSTTEVTVLIEDENDNAPILVFPRVGKDMVEVSSNIAEGQQVAQIEATDIDKDRNQLLTYMILSGNERNFFAMNKDTGSLFLRQALTVGDYLFDIGIVIQDEGFPPLSAEGSLRVKVNSSLAAPRELNSSLLKPDQSTILAIGIVGGLALIILVVVILIVRWFRKYSKDYKDIENKVKQLEDGNNNADAGSASGANISRDSDADSRRSKDSYAAYDDPSFKFPQVPGGHDSDSGWSSDMPNHDNSRDSGLVNNNMYPPHRHGRGAHRLGALWETQIPEDELYHHSTSQLSSSQEESGGFRGRSRHPRQPPRQPPCHHHTDLHDRYSWGNEVLPARHYPTRRNSNLSYDGNKPSVSMAPEPYRPYHSDGSRCSTPQELEASRMSGGHQRRHTRSWHNATANKLNRPHRKTDSWSSSDSMSQSSDAVEVDRQSQRMCQSHGNIQSPETQPEPERLRLARSTDLSALRMYSSSQGYDRHRQDEKEYGEINRNLSQRTGRERVRQLRNSQNNDSDPPQRNGISMCNSNSDHYDYRGHGVEFNDAPRSYNNQSRGYSSGDIYYNEVPTNNQRQYSSHGNVSEEQPIELGGYVNLASDDVIEELEVAV